MTPTRVILMSCGSYNPPTNMHLRMFEIARDHLHRMGTHMVVGGVMSPVHDSYAKKDLVVAEHRCAMLKLALQNNDWIRVSTWETRQNCWTRTRASLKHHQNLLNSVLQNSDGSIGNHIDIEDLEWIPENILNGQDRTPIQIKLLCGADLLESFGKPGLWADQDIDAIVGEHGLVVITREGSNPNKFIYDSDLLSKYMHNIHIVTEWINNEVSSTKIRRALKRGESIKYLTQDAVIDYIYNWGLYDVVTSTTKLILTTTESNNYLHIDDKYKGAFLTPSPSDVTMESPSPVEIISIDLTESVIKKNIINSPVKRSTAVNSDDNECMREKFINIITENSNNKNTAKPLYPGLAKQIIATETGESQIFWEVGLNDTSTSVNNLIYDTESDVHKIETDCPTEFKLENEIKNEQEYLESEQTDDPCIINETVEPDDNNDVEINSQDEEQFKLVDSMENNDDQSVLTDIMELREVLSSPSIPEIQEKNEAQYLDLDIDDTDKKIDEIPVCKSSIESSSRENINNKCLQSMVSLRKRSKSSKNLSEQVVPMIDDESESSTSENTSEEMKKKDTCNFLKQETRKAFQGSLESIVRKPQALSKKSKSFEYIKADLLPKELNLVEIGDINLLEKSGTSKSETFATINSVKTIFNTQTEEYCSVCFSKDQSSGKNLYTVHSTNSSPVDPDSTECEICSSCNLQGVESLPEEPQCELCEICGDVAMELDGIASGRPELEEIIDSRLPNQSTSLNITQQVTKKSKATKLDKKIFKIADEETDEANDEQDAIGKEERPPSTSIEEYSDDSTLDDVEFEIENCGLEMDVSQPQDAAQSIEPVSEEEKSEEIKASDDQFNESKRINRGSSLINRSVPKPDSKKRYSSVDNLQGSKTLNLTLREPRIVKKDRIVAGSVDNIRIARVNKSPHKLRMSADDIGQATKEAEDSPQQLTRQSSEKSRVGTDTVKFIIGKHGLKIVSDRETAL
ncbi:uncharacterized protein LOC123271185 [Cotesia glomerata]|uniref:Nicotinamide/nicotinic acid mononucleotide adenylyltransferase 3 n=1 Tax=Cotesia glomerata TaxID=32391 RepID=A0AAV7IS74_COTGL|nr:uncharacterized protein LOC123271185 [Cotesia glomerata]XP_044593359.1 uncharacterized protein LOC123271185 [Cotesia glomerata]KAH0557890.1 hypothetical protein KQX54_012581 [Cotesia glomerata]